jgi:transposase-like protein
MARHSEEKRHIAIRMASEGDTPARIARALEVSHSTIRRWQRKSTEHDSIARSSTGAAAQANEVTISKGGVAVVVRFDP